MRRTGVSPPRRDHRSFVACSHPVRVAQLLCCAVLLAACQSDYREFEEQMTADWDRGAYSQAGSLSQSAAQENECSEGDRVVYFLEAGRTLQAAGETESSVTYFDLAYTDVRPYLDTDSENSVSGVVVSTALNQTMDDYLATPGERIMLNTFQSLNYMVKGDMESARIELNRAQDWQQDAADRYAEAIEEQQEDLRKKAKSNNISGATSSTVAARYRDLDDLRGYGAYRNPFASHLRGVFMLARGRDLGDRSNARSDLREVAAMVPGARAMLTDDLELADLPPNRGVPPVTWVYFLTGRAPYREQMRIDIPIPIGNVNYVSAAFPRLKITKDHARVLNVSTSEGASATAVTIADFDQIVGSEFRERLPGIIAQEIIGMTLKTLATYKLKREGGTLGQIAGIAFQATSTAADTRSWRTLPKLVQVCSVSTPTDGWITLAGNRGQKYPPVGVRPGESNIIVVTLPSRYAAKPAIMVIQLTGEQSPWNQELSGTTVSQPAA